jgi:hypothetical protein
LEAESKLSAESRREYRERLKFLSSAARQQTPGSSLPGRLEGLGHAARLNRQINPVPPQRSDSPRRIEGTTMASLDRREISGRVLAAATKRHGAAGKRNRAE